METRKQSTDKVGKVPEGLRIKATSLELPSIVSYHLCDGPLVCKKVISDGLLGPYINWLSGKGILARRKNRSRPATT